MTDDERAKLREIIEAADKLFLVAGRLFYDTGDATPADLEAAFQRLFALRETPVKD